MFLAQEIIRKKRDGAPLSAEEIRFLSTACAIIPSQRVKSPPWRCVNSGHTLDWRRDGLSGPVVDKHSTGGIGNVISLMLGPMIAARSGFVPMVSGRGHTGGTLYKLEAIPRLSIFLDDDAFRAQIKHVGVATMGQTHLYSTRDTTATVDSIPFITASILAKKLAEGLDAPVMDVKVGSGSLMPTFFCMLRSAGSGHCDVANGAGCKTTAILTDMNQVLASSASNALEVRIAVRFLTNDERNPRLFEVTIALCSEMLITVSVALGETAARALDSGAATERFDRMAASNGGPADFIQRHDHYLPVATLNKPVFPASADYIHAMDTRALGMTVVALGGGRPSASDVIDYSVGLTDMARLGTMSTACRRWP